MTFLEPNDFFLRNGGRALMEAHGADTTEGLAGYFGSSFPTWASDKTTRPSTTAVTALLICWDGGMVLRTAAKAPADLPPDIDIAKGVGGIDLMNFALKALDLPRPLLFLTVGASYGPDLKSARFSLDPDRIVMSGKISGDLDRLRLKLIADHVEVSSLSVKDLRKMVRTHEAALEGASHLWRAPSLIAKVRKLNEVPKKADASFVEQTLSRFWTGIDALPPAADPSWDALVASSFQAK